MTTPPFTLNQPVEALREKTSLHGPRPRHDTFSGSAPPMTAEVLLETNRLASPARGLFLRPVVIAALCPLPWALSSSRLP